MLLASGKRLAPTEPEGENVGSNPVASTVVWLKTLYLRGFSAFLFLPESEKYAGACRMREGQYFCGFFYYRKCRGTADGKDTTEMEQRKARWVLLVWFFTGMEEKAF